MSPEESEDIRYDYEAGLTVIIAGVVFVASRETDM